MCVCVCVRAYQFFSILMMKIIYLTQKEFIFKHNILYLIASFKYHRMKISDENSAENVQLRTLWSIFQYAIDFLELICACRNQANASSFAHILKSLVSGKHPTCASSKRTIFRSIARYLRRLQRGESRWKPDNFSTVLNCTLVCGRASA